MSSHSLSPIIIDGHYFNMSMRVYRVELDVEKLKQDLNEKQQTIQFQHNKM